MNIETRWLLILPECILLACSAWVLLTAVYGRQQGRHVWACRLTKLGFLVAFAAVIWQWFQLPVATQGWGGLVQVDRLAIVLKGALLLSSALVMGYAYRMIEALSLPMSEVGALLQWSVLGGCVLISANNLLTVFLGLELMTLPLYALIALQRDQVGCLEAGIKYFIMSALATCMLLYGFSLLYGVTGHMDLPGIAQQLAATGRQQAGLFATVFVLAGIAFKFGLMPFHMWVPDVYEGAPAPVALFLASVPKLASMALLLRVLFTTLAGLHAQWQTMLLVLALLSIGGGNLMALVQTRLRRLLAYSAIAHAGTLMLGLVVGSKAGHAAALFYVLTYVWSTLAAFALLVGLRGMSGTGALEYIDELKGLGQRHPGWAFAWLLVLFNLAGVPPLLGFMAKMHILVALVQAHFIGAAVFTMAFAVVGAFYYIRVVKIIYFDAPDSQALPVAVTESASLLALHCASLLLLGLLPSGLLTLCHAAL